MLFSSLSLKVLFGLGTVVGASVLSIHLKNKDTNTGALNSKQGEAVVIPLKPEAVVIPELDEPAMPEPEVAVTPEQAAKKEIERLNKEIGRLDKKIDIAEESIGSHTSDVLKINVRMTSLEEILKNKCDHYKKNRITWKESEYSHEEELKSGQSCELAENEFNAKKADITTLQKKEKVNRQNLSDYKKERNGYTKQLDLLNKKS